VPIIEKTQMTDCWETLEEISFSILSNTQWTQARRGSISKQCISCRRWKEL